MKCIYCGSGAYGKPCVYSPTATHCHCDDPTKCIYCSSKAIGLGCVYNPYGKMHIRPAAFFIQVKENLQKSVVLTYLLERLETLSTAHYISPLDRFYKKLGPAIQNATEPFLEALKLQETPILENIQQEQKETVCEITKRLTEQVSDIRKTLKFANTALPSEIVEQILLKAVLDDK